jgi:hypothetical protein
MEYWREPRSRPGGRRARKWVLANRSEPFITFATFRSNSLRPFCYSLIRGAILIIQID